ncbi:hypothetical protein RF11_14666 [Thelohanellus kitauei]|uniref:Uncharacterized protein n=1 Tax=Thelohanellus kitauei TaxID=669202 RepID=A0A0C2IFC6_THEKT|nr:hypothetical protein RF11_14666 [Thelohanellus kitauei]
MGIVENQGGHYWMLNPIRNFSAIPKSLMTHLSAFNPWRGFATSQTPRMFVVHRNLSKGVLLRDLGIILNMPNILFSFSVAIFVSILKLTSEQAFECTILADESPFLLKSVTVSGCSHDVCRNNGDETQEVTISFVPLVSAKRVEILIHIKVGNDHGYFTEYQKAHFCDLPGIWCPIIAGVHYTTTLAI